MQFTLTHQSPEHVQYHLDGSLIGEKDGVNLISSFEEQLHRGVKAFSFDLSQLSHMNSSGLGVLITLHTKVQKTEGGKMELVGPSAFVRNLLAITKLDTVLTVI